MATRTFENVTQLKSKSKFRKKLKGKRIQAILVTIKPRTSSPVL
jgi:hypothetical protein